MITEPTPHRTAPTPSTDDKPEDRGSDEQPEGKVPPWVPPALLMSVLMLGTDVVVLVPLGEWMAEYGVVLVGTPYLIHVLASTALAMRSVAGLSPE
ncbi:hypothetical protein ACIGO9_31235 [Nocardia asteroides]|uniref:hypothetical protein n=1 Tax=Nocardia asteroides TaxID=1824 RepID=UPI0037C65879